MKQSKAQLIIKKLLDEGLLIRGDKAPPVRLIPTGIKALDELLGGGVPAGQLTEAYGPYGSGKSTIGYHVLAANRGLKMRHIGKYKANAVVIPTEGGFDGQRAGLVGADLEHLFYMLPEYGEQALDAVFAFAAVGLKLVVVDSLRGLVPARVMDDESVGDDNVAAQARLFAKFWTRYALTRKRPAVFAVNQVTNRIGVMGWADPYTTPGGNAIKHIAYLRLEVKKRSTLKLKDKPVGQEVAVRITKSKYCAPMRDTTLFLLYDRGYVDTEAWNAMRSKKHASVEEAKA